MSETAPTKALEGAAVNSWLRAAAGGALGGAVVGAGVVLERTVFHPRIYGGGIDVLLHAAWSVVVSACAGGVLFGALHAAVALVLPEGQHASPRKVATAGAVAGLALGPCLYWIVILPSKYGQALSLTMGLVGAMVLGGLVGGIAAVTMHRVAHRRPMLMAAGTFGAATVGCYLDLHRYMRSYGHVHLLLGATVLVASGYLGALALRRTVKARTRQLALALGTVFGAGLTLLALVRPTPGARLAVLVYGGIEKTFVQWILWPVADSDRDGFARLAWGTDCDDEDPAVHPLAIPARSRYLGCGELGQRTHASAAPETPSRVGAPRSVVWIMVDTLRADAAAATRAAFPDFRRFPEYRSCGSDTRSALLQLLGSRGCRPPGLERSIIQSMRERGYQTGAFIEYTPPSLRLSEHEIDDVFGSFDVVREHLDPRGLIDDATQWMNTQRSDTEPFVLYVHLWGGHAPYNGPGNTPWERYLASTESTMALVHEFATKVHEDHVVVIMGDHGEEFGEHDGTGHAFTLYEEVLTPPMWVRGAGPVASINSCSGLVTAMSAWTGGAQDSLQAAQPSSDQLARVDFPAPDSRGPGAIHLRSLRLPTGLKVIWDLSLDIWELYDLTADPKELDNIATHRPDELLHAAEQLAAALERCDGTDAPR